MIDPASLPDDLDAACLATRDTDAVVRSLHATCEAEGLVPAAPEELPPPGSYRHGEEDPRVRRFLVSPPLGRWTIVLLSAPDWDHDWLPGWLARLGVAAAYPMLHDGDVFTLHLYDEAGRETAALVTSPVHFDLEPGAADPRLGPALERLAGRPLAPGELHATCLPPGRIDVAGALAFARTAALLGLPDEAACRYARAVDVAGRPMPTHAAWRHACFQREWATDDDAGDGPGTGAGGRLLAFRPPRR